VKVGFIGLGNLGLPCALALEHYGGHELYGYDPSERALEPLRTKRFPRIEPGVDELLRSTELRLSSPSEMAGSCEIVFVAVQTPHHPKFEGITPLGEERADFDYSFLRAAVSEISDAARGRDEPLIVNVVSTVLPGTMRREIEPLLKGTCRLSYNPFFIAMGTTIADFLQPEFVLLGAREEGVLKRMGDFYAGLHSRPCYGTTIEAAELIKVSYNTFIGLKLAFVNTLMEACEKLGVNVDDVTGALTKATDRLISEKYMKAGMGDGGGCHPRDNIAMSYMARRLGLSFDLFEAAMVAREGHTNWLATEILDAIGVSGLPIVILGRAYKANSDLTAGSPAQLLIHVLESAGLEPVVLDPFTDSALPAQLPPAVYFVATNHDLFKTLTLPDRSIVLDPWGDQPERQGVVTRKLGRRVAKVHQPALTELRGVR
jgi:UDPglucose 6-dehydrogenase